MMKPFLILLLGISLVWFFTDDTFGGEMPKCTPTKDDFSASDVNQDSQDWAIERKPDTGGADMDQTLWAADDRIVVDWDTRERACSRCHGDHGITQLAFQQRGPFSLPRGVVAGVRFDKGCPTCPGASYKGTATMLTVTFDKWLAVLTEKYLTCK